MNRAGEIAEEVDKGTEDTPVSDETQRQPLPNNDALNELLRAKAENEARKASEKELTDEQRHERYEITIRKLEAKYGSQLFKYTTHQGTVEEMLRVCPAVQDIAFRDGFEATVQTLDRYRIDAPIEEKTEEDEKPQLDAENDVKNDTPRYEREKTSQMKHLVPPRLTSQDTSKPTAVVVTPVVMPAAEPVPIPVEREVPEAQQDEANEVSETNDEASEKNDASPAESHMEQASDASDPVSAGETVNVAVPEVHDQGSDASGSDVVAIHSVESAGTKQPAQEVRQAGPGDAPSVARKETGDVRASESAEREAPANIEPVAYAPAEADVQTVETLRESEAAHVPIESVVETEEVQEPEPILFESRTEYDAQLPEFIVEENADQAEVVFETPEEPYDVLEDQFVAREPVDTTVEQTTRDEPFVSLEEERDASETAIESAPATTSEIERAIETFQGYAAENMPAEELLVSIAEHAQYVADREPDTETIDASDEEKEAVSLELQLLIERTRTVRETADRLFTALTKEECETHVSDLVESLAVLLRSLGYESPEKMVSQLIASYSVESLRALLYELEASLCRAAASEVAGRRSTLRENKKLRHSRVGKIVLSIIRAFTPKQPSFEAA